MDAIGNKFQSFELKHSLFDVEVEAVPIWERLRFRVFRQIQRQNGAGRVHTDVGNDWRDYVRGTGLFLKNFFASNPYLAGEHDFLYIGHHRRKKREDDLWWDVYCDLIHEFCDEDYVHFEKDYRLSHLKPAKTTNLRYLDLITQGTDIVRELGIFEPDISQSQAARLDKISDAIRAAFGAEVDILSAARKELHARRVKLPLYRRLLRVVNPDLAVLVVSYGRESFIEACKLEEVPVAEVQHGVIHENHFGYSFSGPRTKTTFPDYLLTFGRFWVDTVEFPIPDDRVIPVGYPYLEEAVENDTATEDDQLLFISQGNIGEELSKFAIELERHPGFEYEIVYKLHPGEYDRWKDEYPWLLDANFDVVDSEDKPLYELFAESKAQIGVGSTAVYEGLAFDLETYVLDCSGWEILEPIVESGAAKLVTSVEDVASTIGNTTTSFDREYFFRANSKHRICQVLNALQDGAKPAVYLGCR